MYTSETQLRVRYGETDQMGYVYYGNYASYLEVARVECLRQLGFSYRELEQQGIMLPVLEHHSFFRSPAYYDDLLKIVTTIPEKPGVRIRFKYEIVNEQNNTIHEAETLLVFVNKATGKPCKPTEVFNQLLAPFFS